MITPSMKMCERVDSQSCAGEIRESSDRQDDAGNAGTLGNHRGRRCDTGSALTIIESSCQSIGSVKG